MSLLQHTPRFDADTAIAVAKAEYGLDGTATSLTSERDQNFLITTPGGERFVLKIANAAEDRATLEAQNAAMSLVATRTALCPRLVPTTAGADITDLSVRDGSRYFVRLFTWIHGTPLCTVPHHPLALLEDLGRRLGELDAALEAFDHPAVHRDFYWDVANGLRIVREYSPHVTDPLLRSRVIRIAERIEKEDAPKFEHLRRSVIHNDANDHNVIVDAGSSARAPRIVGLIDFGDMVHTFTVAEVAVACAYAMLGKSDPLAAATGIVRGYHQRHRLTDAEIASIFPLICLRLCMSVCLAHYQQQQRPDDEYLSISQSSIRKTLPELAGLSPRSAEAVFREACEGSTPSTERLDKSETLARRRVRIGRNLSLAYRDPVRVVRGWMQYLFDETGRRYLDAYNNVPHVGHCHPRVVKAATDQMRVLNTNTRYLHDNLVRYAERLSSTLPDPLSVCYFVNSGSEANELALRLARAHTRRRGLVVLDAAYHGNTTTLIDISPYKANGPGGEGLAPWVRPVAMPDVYRGPFKASDPKAGEKYAVHVAEAIDALRRQGVGLAGYIAESCPSVGGQIVFPSGYLHAAYRAAREADGVCIADEVQTAYGRMGSDFYAFQAQRVVPDIVVLGKPIGNGYPIGAVVTTPEIAASFDNGMEFFSTFGGNTVSCAIGLAVLDIVVDEGLQAHARCVGEHLLANLRPLADRHAIVGDVRGSGLFIGVELVRNRDSLEPGDREASLVVERMREEGILIGTDGPFANVLKIRPPMPFDETDADRLSATLDRVLEEFM